MLKVMIVFFIALCHLYVETIKMIKASVTFKNNEIIELGLMCMCLGVSLMCRSPGFVTVGGNPHRIYYVTYVFEHFDR